MVSRLAIAELGSILISIQRLTCIYCFCKIDCLEQWEFNKRIFSYPNNCGDPDNIMDGKAWCYVNPVACKTTSSGKKGWDYCTPNVIPSAKAPAPAPATTKAPVLLPAGSELTQTISGCICADWSSQTGYTEKHNQCGHDKGQGTWCFVRDKTCESGREYGFCEESKIGKEEKDRLEKIRTDKARAAFAVPGKTLKGCECDLWSSHNGYTSFGAACGHDIGNGKWYVLLFT